MQSNDPAKTFQTSFQESVNILPNMAIGICRYAFEKERLSWIIEMG
jgi:hypothetical protein